MRIEDAIQQRKPFQSPKQKAMVNILYTANVLGHLIGPVLERFELSHPQYNVLRILRGRLPDCACPGELKDVMIERNPDVTRLCDRLAAKGLIERHTNPDNRRKVSIIISQKGLAMLAEIDPLIMNAQEQFSGITDEEANLLSDLLDKLRG